MTVKYPRKQLVRMASKAIRIVNFRLCHQMVQQITIANIRQRNSITIAIIIPTWVMSYTALLEIERIFLYARICMPITDVYKVKTNTKGVRKTNQTALSKNDILDLCSISLIASLILPK